MADLQITASKSNRTLVSATPDRAVDLQARRKRLADPVLLFYRRLLDSALAEAKKTTRHGLPTDMALKTLHWIQVPNRNLDMADPDDKVMHLVSFEGGCEMLGLNVKAERKRMLLEIKAAYAEAAATQIQRYVKGRMAAVLTCAGIKAMEGRQYVLGLVSPDEHDEIAGVERPDPPARSRQQPPAPRPRRRAA